MERRADNVGTREQFARVITQKPRNFRQQRVFSTLTIFLNAFVKFRRRSILFTTKYFVVGAMRNRWATTSLANSKGKQLCKRTARHSPWTLKDTVHLLKLKFLRVPSRSLEQIVCIQFAKLRTVQISAEAADCCEEDSYLNLKTTLRSYEQDKLK